MSEAIRQYFLSVREEKVQELDWKCDILIKNLSTVRKHIGNERLDAISSIGEVQLNGPTIDRLCGELAVLNRCIDSIDRAKPTTMEMDAHRTPLVLKKRKK